MAARRLFVFGFVSLHNSCYLQALQYIHNGTGVRAPIRVSDTFVYVFVVSICMYTLADYALYPKYSDCLLDKDKEGQPAGTKPMSKYLYIRQPWQHRYGPMTTHKRAVLPEITHKNIVESGLR